MENKFTAKASVHVNAPVEKVWDALTNPAIIEKYFFGTKAVSDWKVGSPLHFTGVWEGKEYLDKGTILKSEFAREFQYDYFSSFSGLEDLPENYATITYHLHEEDGGTRLDVSQNNIATDGLRAHSEQNWTGILTGMKQLLEETN